MLLQFVNAISLGHLLASAVSLLRRVALKPAWQPLECTFGSASFSASPIKNEPIDAQACSTGTPIFPPLAKWAVLLGFDATPMPELPPIGASTALTEQTAKFLKAALPGPPACLRSVTACDSADQGTSAMEQITHARLTRDPWGGLEWKEGNRLRVPMPCSRQGGGRVGRQA